MKSIENSIFNIHKADYLQICTNLINKRGNKRTFEVQLNPRNDYEFITFNPYLTTKQKFKINSRNTWLRENKCIACSDRDNLTVMHLFKKNVFGEYDDDHTITLCANCRLEIEKEINEMEKTILKPLTGIYYFIQALLCSKKINFEDNKTFAIHILKSEQRYSFVLEGGIN